MPRRNHKKHHKQSTHKSTEIESLSMALVVNGRAFDDGPKTKKWSTHDIRDVHPLTINQQPTRYVSVVV